MSLVLQAVKRHAEAQPDLIALEGRQERISYGELAGAIDAAATALAGQGIRTAALLADNGPVWVITDLALLKAGIPLVPVPLFFSPSQTYHLIVASGVDLLLTDRPEPVGELLQAIGISSARPRSIDLGGRQVHAFPLKTAPASLPAGCAKVTFTSGSTGEPKGVCLRQSAMESVAASLAEATEATPEDRHLSLLPYATLLENVGGIYAPLLAGATISAPGLAAVGMTGANSLDAKTFVTSLIAAGATSCILIPQMLHALVAAIEAGMPRPEALRFIAVGGAHVSESLLARANALSLPVYEGYGLSESASVVAVNRPGANRLASVGRPLPHIEVDFASDGEILVRGSLFSGYLGEAEQNGADFWPTGDLGFLDDDGFLHLRGRKKHLFITAFGRNVSPEWVESELAVEAAIEQSCVFGEARPFNVAVIQPRQGFGVEQVQQAVDSANARLPDYARIGQWLPAREPFTVTNGLWTGTGRPRRQQIIAAYGEAMERLYREQG